MSLKKNFKSLFVLGFSLVVFAGCTTQPSTQNNAAALPSDVPSECATTNLVTIKSEKGEMIVDYLKKKKISKMIFIPDNKKAVKELLKKKSKYVAITGSLYLLSAVYSIIRSKVNS